jgi:hypothetical protein
MNRILIPYLSVDDVINEARRRQADLFEEMMRRPDADPLPPEPEPDHDPLVERVRATVSRIVGRIAGRTEGAGA